MNNAIYAEKLYRTNLAPWDIGGPQSVIRQLAALGVIRGDVLDPGCGTGWHAIEYARSGCNVTGLDMSSTAIGRARKNAQRAGVAVDFKMQDVTDMANITRRFDTVVDSKCFDNIEAEQRRDYAAELHRVTRPGGKLFLFAFGAGDVNGFHNHLSARDADDAKIALSSTGWDITYIGATTYRLAGHYQPLCKRCPPHLAGPLSIPMVQIHADRR